MTGIVWLVGAADQLHDRHPVGIIVVAVDELLTVGSMTLYLFHIINLIHHTCQENCEYRSCLCIERPR